MIGPTANDPNKQIPPNFQAFSRSLVREKIRSITAMM